MIIIELQMFDTVSRCVRPWIKLTPEYPFKTSNLKKLQYCLNCVLGLGDLWVSCNFQQRIEKILVSVMNVKNELKPRKLPVQHNFNILGDFNVFLMEAAVERWQELKQKRLPKAEYKFTMRWTCLAVYKCDKYAGTTVWIFCPAINVLLDSDSPEVL